MIWLIGTKRIVGVDESDMPEILERYLDMASIDYSYVYGDFEVCPLELDRPGHMRAACVSDAKRLVVQNLRRARPAFRIRSTWPEER